MVVPKGPNNEGDSPQLDEIRKLIDQGDLKNAEKIVNTLLSEDMTGKDSIFEIDLEAEKGRLLWYKGKLNDSQILFNQTLTNARKLNYTFGIAYSLNYIGNIVSIQGKSKLALEYYRESLSQYRNLNDQIGISTVLNNVGVILQDRGDFQKALEKHTECLEIHQNIKNRRGEWISLYNFGLIYGLMGEYEKSLEAYRNALSIADELNNLQGIAATHCEIGKIYKAFGDDNMATEHLKRGIQTYNSINVVDPLRLDGCLTLSLIQVDKGEEIQGRENLTIAKDLADQTSSQSWNARVLATVGFFELTLNNLGDAKNAAQKSIQKAEKLDDHRAWILGRLCLAEILIHQASLDFDDQLFAEAQEHLSLVLETSEQRRLKSVFASVLILQGHLTAIRGLTEEGFDLLQQAKTFTKEQGFTNLYNKAQKISEKIMMLQKKSELHLDDLKESVKSTRDVLGLHR